MRLKIEKLSFGPGAIAHDADGRVVFVQGSVPGDTVEATIYKEESRCAYAFIESVLEKGPFHVEAPCPLVGRCGGCPWGNVSEELQRQSKYQNVNDALFRTAKLSEEEIEKSVFPLGPLEKAWGYRNKIELSVSKTKRKFSLGKRGLNPKDFVPVEKCFLLPEGYQDLPRKISGALAYALGNTFDSTPNLSVQRVGIRVSKRTGSLELSLWGSPGPLERYRIAKTLEEGTGATSIVRCLLKGSQRKRFVSKIEVLSGKGYWAEKIAGNLMRFSAPSFAQANTKGAEKLIDFLEDKIERNASFLNASTAFDLYSGAGTFTLPLARRFREVETVESSGFAVRDLQRNLEINHVKNVFFRGGDAFKEYPEGDPQVIVVDPPRAGLSKEVVKTLCASEAEMIFYVSCNPQTLARDIARFRNLETFQLKELKPFEMFGQTYHTESIAVLARV